MSRDDSFVPIMPRILDPELKFDEKSIMAGIEKSQKTFETAKSAATVTAVPKKTSVMKLVVEYKFYIIIALVLIVAIFLLYRYFKGRKKTTNVDTTDPVFNSIDTGSDKPVQPNKEQFNEFIDESDNESDFCEEYIKKEVRLSDIDEIIPDFISEPESVKSTHSIKSEPESIKSEPESVKSTHSIKSEPESVKSTHSIKSEPESVKSTKSSDFLMEDALDVFQRYQ
jgi:hypothetical protein